MKECPVSFLKADNCNERPNTECTAMANEGVPEGRLEAMTEFFRGRPTELLQVYARQHSPGGKYADRCRASCAIVQAAASVLAERGLEPSLAG